MLTALEMSGSAVNPYTLTSRLDMQNKLPYGVPNLLYGVPRLLYGVIYFETIEP